MLWDIKECSLDRIWYFKAKTQLFIISRTNHPFILVVTRTHFSCIYTKYSSKFQVIWSPPNICNCLKHLRSDLLSFHLILKEPNWLLWVWPTMGISYLIFFCVICKLWIQMMCFNCLFSEDLQGKELFGQHMSVKVAMHLYFYYIFFQWWLY